MPEITIQSADGGSHRFPLTKERVCIGRSRENDIFLPDQWLSRHHAEIRRDGCCGTTPAHIAALKDLLRWTRSATLPRMS